MTQINVRIDDKLKRSVEDILGYLGLSHSDAIRLFYHQIINNKGIPFDLKMHEPSETTLEAMEEVKKNVKQGRRSKKYTDSTTLMSDLLKD